MKKILYVTFLILLCNCSSTKKTQNITEDSSDDLLAKSSMSEKEFIEINEYFKSLDLKFIKGNNTVIVYIDNDPRSYQKGYQVPWDIFYGNLPKNLNSIEKCNFVWIINNRVKDLYYYHGNKINWKVDRGAFLRNKVFYHEGRNGGFLIVDSNGEHFFKEGEYTKKELIQTYKNFIK